MRNWMLVVCVLATVTGAQADCDKSTAELVKFLLPQASTNFAVINGGANWDGGFQYHLTPVAEQFCPEVFLLEHTAANGEYPEFWEAKFDRNQSGTGDDVALSLIKTLSPVLKAAGYQDKPYVNNRDVPQTYKIEWIGPSDTWVSITTYLDDSEPGKIGYGIKVAHSVK